MAQTKTEILSLLAAAETHPRHRFGQNFMIDQNLVKLIADAGLIGPKDLVIEVGPGTGTLTDELLQRAAEVVAVEIDRDLAGMLRERYSAQPKLRLVEGDALAGKHELNQHLTTSIEQAQSAGRAVKLVANLPYNIASPLVVELLSAGVELLVFTVQREVADRLRAAHGGEDYGPLTVMTQMLGTVEVMRVLPPSAFFPPPKIDSALVRIRRADKLGKDAREFSRFVQSVFSSRRKTMRKALTLAGHDASMLAKAAIDEQIRPEGLTPADFWRLYLLCTAAGAGGTAAEGTARAD
jgi:16S rRNA (adenine1518-N6/adenine1519-N6)-dimethyltransferase